MSRLKIFIPFAMVLLLVALLAGCNKERIVESTEIVHDIEYIELPPDTIMIYDTVVTFDSVAVHTTDTLTVTDTVVQVNTVYDTVVQTNTIYDTITTIQFDTVVELSTVPNEMVALGVLEYYVDPLVLEFTNAEFGMPDGWIYYLSTWQSAIAKPSAGVYDIFGYIEFWAPDWSGYYSLEYYYRISHTGGDPADVANWVLSEPPTTSPTHSPGLRATTTSKQMPGSLSK